jgi:chloramphenicol-sensitive protein RarD
MSPSAAAPAESRRALVAGIVCYLIWGALPILFFAMGKAGASSWEIVGQRVLWAPPAAGLLVLMSGRLAAVGVIFRQPKVLAQLALSAVLIAINWLVYVWAVNHGRNLEASLGYYINPLIAMAAGALIFRERLDGFGRAAIALAAAGVALQALALGRLPLISLTLALSFGSYGIIRKRVDADAQTGLFVECLLLFPFAAAMMVWLAGHGGVAFGSGLGTSALLAFAGPVTVLPLALFSWAARRLPLSTIGFLQFIAPTINFVIGVERGEPLTALRIASFVFIWGGAAAFAFGAWRAVRRARLVVA